MCHTGKYCIDIFVYFIAGCNSKRAIRLDLSIRQRTIDKDVEVVMIRKKIKGYLIASLFLLSAMGLSAHIWMHSPAQFSYGYVPLIAGIISTFAIPLLFCFRKTLHLANILNGFTAIIGLITMTHFMTTGAPMYFDIALVIIKFLLGISVFSISLYPDLNTSPAIRGWSLIRYPNMGFWYVHLVLLSAVYTLGHIIWR
jgi:hypothetical protein